MNTTNLTEKTCVPCEGGVPALLASEAEVLMTQLDPGWELDMSGGGVLKRKLNFKGFAKAVYAANLAAFLADREGHHPDIRFGWGYCEIQYTTHDIGGMSENDFICAAKFDRLFASR